MSNKNTGVNEAKLVGIWPTTNLKWRSVSKTTPNRSPAFAGLWAARNLMIWNKDGGCSSFSPTHRSQLG